MSQCTFSFPPGADGAVWYCVLDAGHSGGHSINPEKGECREQMADAETVRLRARIAALELEAAKADSWRQAAEGFRLERDRLRALCVWGTTSPVGPLYDRLAELERVLEAAEETLAEEPIDPDEAVRVWVDRRAGLHAAIAAAKKEG